MSLPLRDRVGTAGRYVLVFLTGVLVTALIVLVVAIAWRSSTTPTSSPPAPAPSSSTPPAASGSATPTPSIDPDANDAEHDHDTLEDEKPQWEPAVLGFAKHFTDTSGGAAKWRQRLAPYVAPAVRDQLADVDIAKVPAGRYDSYELLETGNYQIAAKTTYREGWALILYVTSDGRAWKVTAYDKYEE